MFVSKNRGQLNLEANLMLALYKALQKGGVESKVWFSWVWYIPSGSVSALLTEKVNVIILLSQWLNLIIRAVKTIENIISRIEILEK